MNYAGSVLGGILAVIPLMASLTVAPRACAQGTAGIGTREVLLGTSTTPGRSANPSTEREAQDYYDLAERELRLGRSDVARRHLELLIARYPGSQIASVARHDLIALYGDRRDAPQRQAEIQRPVAASASADLGPKSKLGVPPPPADVPFAIGSSDAAPNGWRTSVAPAAKPADGAKRATRKVQDAFRQSAGDLVFFSDGSAELGARARRVLEAQADWLKAQPTARVTIEGHADDSGSPAENQRLSEARAKAVQARLIDAGIEPARLTVSAVGRADRVADCDDSACAAQNRRASTVIVATSIAEYAVPARTASSGGDSSVGGNPGRLPWATAPTPSPR
jgi:outer membrane protein OmpA-like peptidoglycan-associated protein